MPLTAAADCTTVGINITCSVAGGAQTTVVGTGDTTPSGTSVEVEASAVVTATDTAAISLGEDATITIRDGATVSNTAAEGASSSPFYPGAGANTLEVGAGSTILVEQNATVMASGPGNSNNDSEAVNFFGNGTPSTYTLTNDGYIGSANATMWFQAGATGTATIVNNGTMEANIGSGVPGFGTVLGNSGSVAVDFSNRGDIIGSLGFGGGDDALHVYTDSSITGDISGGGGNNLLTLNMNGTPSDTFNPNSLSGFQTLENRGGIWTLDVALPGSGITTTRVTGGTLILGQDASTYTGLMAVDAAGTLQTSGQFAPLAISNDGLVRFEQPTDGGYAGVVTGTGSVEKTGAGVLTFTGNQAYTGGTTISAGTLQIGNGGTTGSIVGNVANNGILAFNRANDVTYAGNISGGGTIQQNGAGATIFSGTNTYTGATAVNSGTLRAGAANTFSTASAHNVAAGATLDLNGFNQAVGALSNAGTVRLLSTAPGVQLTVNGDYVGTNGLLQMGTQLGADASPTDRLIITGNASGNTTVEVTNLGGLGAQTTGNGIELISIGGATTANAFMLAGGQVNAGAYEYRLFAGSASGAGSNWYLRTINNAVTAFRPEVALNAALPGLLAQSDLAMLGTLHQRIGDNSAAMPAEEKRHVWGRVIGQRIKTDHGGDVSPSTEGSFSGLQVGSDLLQLGAHRFGVYGGYLHGDSDVRGFASGLQHNKVGNLDLDNKYLGAYWTFQNDAGWYTDTVLQQAWCDGETNSRGGADNDIEGNGTQLSFEVGKSIPLNATWMLEPQAQLIVGWMNIDGQQIVGADIDQDTDTTLTSRLGLRLKGDYATNHGRLQPYGRFNVWHGSNGAYTMTFAGPAGSTDIRTEHGYTSGQLALGLTWTVSDRVNVYGEVGHMFSLDNGNQQVRQPIMATVGLRMDW